MEIVIENPVETSPPTPPPPPPPPPPSSLIQSLPMSTWNSIVTTPQATTLSTSNVASTSLPSATTVMTITIAENPTVTYPPPVQFSYRETYAANTHPYTGDQYSIRRGQPRGRSYDDPDGASPSVRRIDKSGLLGITEPEGLRTSSLRSSRYLSGVNTLNSGMLSPRRFECVGQLDPVPEIPGQTTRGNLAPGVTAGVFPVVDTILEKRDGSRLDTCETLSVVNLARPMKSASFDSLEQRYRNDPQSFDRDLDGIESSNLDVAGYKSSFRLEENCDIRARTLGRLSRLSLARKEQDTGNLNARYSETCCNFPFTVRKPTTFPEFEGCSSLPSTRGTTTAVTTSTTTVAAASSTIRQTDVRNKEDGSIVDGSDEDAPEEERAEAEGCEHGSSRNPMKDGETSERGEEFTDNDGIQTLRVIILSEQL